MYTNPLLSLALLSLPLLSSAVPQDPPVNNPAPANPQVAPQQPQANPTPAQPTTTLSPDQRNAQYDAKYASLASAALTDPNYLAFSSGLSAASIPVTIVSQQEASYILALKTATASIPEPAYITNLPQDQQSWIRGFHQQLAGPTPAASAPSGVLPPMPSSSSSANGTSVSGQSGAPTASVVNGSTVPVSSVSGSPTDTATNAQVPPPPRVPTATVDVGNGTNGTNDTSGAMGTGEGRGGLLGMGAMGLFGVVAVMVLL